MTPDTRRTRAALGLLLVTTLGVLTVDTRAGTDSPLQPLRRWVGDAFGPVEVAAASAIRPVGNLVGSVGEIGGKSPEERVAELERENETLRLQLRASGVDRRRVEELDKLLRVAGLGQYRVVPARVIAFGPGQGFAYTATIDAGERDGLRPDLTVLNGDGLVGRVKAVTRTTSTVVLSTDPSSSVGVRMESGKLGVAQGGGAEPLQVDLFDPTAAVRPGDRLVTVGSRGAAPFVPGVPVGEVVEVDGITSTLTKRTRVRPYADFGALDLVGVVVDPPLRDPRDALLPPRPQPAPAPGAPAAPTPGPSGTTPASPSPSATAPAAPTPPRRT